MLSLKLYITDITTDIGYEQYKQLPVAKMICLGIEITEHCDYFV